MNTITESAITKTGIGAPVQRIEDLPLITGQGQYTDNFNAPDQAHIAFVRSPYAHARIAAIDVSTARQAPGVLAVYTGQHLVDDKIGSLPNPPLFKRPDGKGGQEASTSPPRRGLAHEVVRFVGEAVAAVVANTREQALDAIDLVQVEYEELPAVAEARHAVKPGAPQVWPAASGNLAAAQSYGDVAATDAAFAQAAHVVKCEIDNQRIVASAMEPRAALVEFDAASGVVTLQLPSQQPGIARDVLAGAIFKLPPDKVRVKVGDIGGGFGMKAGVHPEDIVVTYAAMKLQRPVKWRATRAEDFLAGVHGRDVTHQAEMALDANGKVLGLRVRSLGNMGAYVAGPGLAIQLLLGPFVITSIYDIPVIDFAFQGILTHTSPTAAYRGAGRPEAIFLIERLMEKAARLLKLPQEEVRRRNMIAKRQMPFTTAMKQVYDSGDFASVLDQALVLSDTAAGSPGYAARKAASAARGMLRGRGISTFLEWTGGNVFDERVTFTVDAQGTVSIFAATMGMGQGLKTSYAQVASSALGLPLDQIKIVMGDTAQGPGFGSVGSRSLFTGGSAIAVGAERLVAHLRELAAAHWGCAAEEVEYFAGELRRRAAPDVLLLASLAEDQPGKRVFIESKSTAGGPTWPNSCHIAEVEVDPETGITTIDRYTAVDDVGRVVNPIIVRGQVEGGIVQGLGQALCEAVRYDPDSAQMQTASYMDYGLPRAGLLPAITHHLDESNPCLTNPLGVKGCGELGTIGATPTLVNAILDALHERGVEEIAMPLTPARVWGVLQGLRGASL